MTVLSVDEWRRLDCGCQADLLGAVIVDIRCRRHAQLIAPRELEAMQRWYPRSRTYGPIDFEEVRPAGSYRDRMTAGPRHR